MNDLPRTNNTLLSINEASRELGVSNKTLRRWENKMLLVPMRTLGGHRRYSKAQVDAFKKQRKHKVTSTTPLTASSGFTASKTKGRLKNRFGLAFIVAGLALLFILTGKYTFNEIDLGKVKSGIDTKISSIAENIRSNFEINKLETFGKNKTNNVLAELTTAEDVEFNVNIEANFEELITANAEIIANAQITANADIATESNIFNLVNENATTLNIGGAATSISIGAATGTTAINNTLQVGANTINSPGDLTLDAGGGGVSIGTGTAASVDLTGDDLYVTGDFEVDGTSYIPTLNINGDSITDITGTGLQLSSGSLQTTLGTGISSSEIDDDTIKEVDLYASNAATNGYLLTYNSSTGGFTWTNSTTLAGPWTLGTDVIYARTTTDNLILGGTTSLAKLGIDGDADEVQLLVQGNSTQTEDIFVIEESDGTDILRVANDGSGTLTHSSSSNFAINLTGTGDFVIQDGGTAFATFSDNGIFTVNSVTLDAGTISSTGDVTIDPTTNLVFSDLDCTGNTNGGALTVDASGVVSCSDDAGEGAGGAAWSASGGKIYPTTISDELGIGTSTTAEIISKLYVTSDSSLTGKAVAIFNQAESEDIITASASGYTKFFIDNNGRMAVGYNKNTGGAALSYPFEVYNEGTTQVAYITTAGVLQIDSDLTVGGGDINVAGEAADIEIANATANALTVSEGSNEYLNITTNDTESVTLDLPVAGASSTTGNLFTSNIAKTINIGTGTAIDSINIGTGGTNADDINIGGLATSTIDILGVSTFGDGGSTNYASFNATGDLSFVGSGDTITGPGAGGFTITNTSGNVSLVTATAGDVTLGPPTSLGTGDDLYFQDGTLSAAIPLTSAASSLNTPTSAIIDAINEAYAAATGGSGGAWTLASNVIYPSTLSNRVGIGTTTTGDVISKLYISSEATNLTGKALAILNQTESEDIFTASQSGDKIFTIAASGEDTGELRLYEEASNGIQYTGFKAPASLAANVVYTLPTASAASGDYVLTWQTGDALQWKEITGVGAAGDITTVGSIESGIAFASSATADDQWLGIGATDGRIEFDDQTIDEVNIRAAKLGLGTATPLSLFHAETNTTALTGKAVAIINQLESEDIFTASASNATKFFIDNNGRVAIGYSNATGGTALTNPFEVYNEGTTQVAYITTAGVLQIDSDLTVGGGDINVAGEAADIEIANATANALTVSEGSNEYLNITTNDTESVTLDLPVAGVTSTIGNLFTSDIAKTINLGTGIAIDTINIGTGGTGADVISIGSSNAGNITIQSNAVLNLTGSTNSLIDFPNFDVSTAGAITAASNLDINGITNDIAGALNLSGNSLTASGDLLIDPAGDDITFDGDLLVNNAFTLQVGGKTATSYNVFADDADTSASGQLDSDDDLFVGGSVELLGSLCFGADCVSNWSTGGASPWSYSAPYLYPDNTTDRVGIGTTTTADIDSRLYVTSPSAIGAALAIFNQTENQPILSASNSAETRFSVGYLGDIDATADSTLTTGNILDLDWEGATSLSGAASGLTITATDINGNGQNFYGIDISDLGTAGGGNEYAINIGSGWDANLNFEGAGDINIVDNTSSALTISEAGNNYLNITTDNADTAVTLDLPVVGSNSTTGNLFTSNVAKTINIGTGTAADAINIGTGGTAADTLTFGNIGVATTFTFNSGATTTTPLTFDFDTVTNTTAVDLSLDGLTSGTGLLLDDNTAAGLSSGTLLQAQSVTTDATAITDGLLGYFNWNPGSATTKAGDLFRINIGTNGNVDNIFNVTDNGSSLFSVGEAGITSAVPHEFTAAGDVSIAYDIQFTNQTASYVKSYAPLYIQAGEPQESNNLTLQTFNSGNVVIDTNKLDMTTRATIGNIFGIDWAVATTQTGALVGIDVDMTNLTSVAASTTYGIHVNDLAAQTTSTEYGIYQEGTNWDRGLYVEDTAELTGQVSIGSEGAFGAADTTPSVAAGSYFTTDGTGQTLTDFDDGIDGMILIVESTDATVFDCATAGPLICGDDAENITTADNDITMWINNGGDAGLWHLVSFVDVSTQQTGADLAEWYPVKADNFPQAGEVVSIGESLGTYTTSDGKTHDAFSVKRADSAYDSKMIGIVSTQAHETMGEDILDWAEYAVQVGLVGRVPVKIASTSEPIEIGDFVTSSTEPGRAQKATVEGYTIGKALEKWSPDSDKNTILVYLNASVKLGELADGVILSEAEGSLADASYLDLLGDSSITLGMTATNSANLADIKVTDLTVYGDTTLGDTLITGNLNIGTLNVDGFANSIDAVGTLKIQPLALGDVEIQGGLVKIDQLGNIVAQEITAKKYNVAGASAGTATISGGSKSVFVSTGLVTNESLIFVTPKQTLSYPLAVTAKDTGNGFTVSLPTNSNQNIEFDWFIIDKE